MDAETMAALGEFTALFWKNWNGFSVVESAMRGRALMELSALTTEQLCALAHREAPQPSV